MAAMKKADRKSHGPFLLHRTPAAEGDKAAAPPPENASVSAVRVAQTERFVDAIQVQYKNGEGDWHGSFESSGELSAWQTLACMGDEHVTRVVVYLTPEGQVRRLKVGTSEGRVLDSAAVSGIDVDVDAGGTTTRMCDSAGDVLRGVAEALTVRDGVATREVSFLFGAAAPPRPPPPPASAKKRNVRSFSAPEARPSPPVDDAPQPEIVNERETLETYFRSASNTSAALMGLDLLRANLCYPRSSTPRGGKKGGTK